MNLMKTIHRGSNIRYFDYAYVVALFVLLFLVLIRSGGLWSDFGSALPQIPIQHWLGLFISLLGYGTVALVALLLSRAVGRLSFLFCFNLVLFGLFFVEQLYILLQLWRWIPETGFLWAVVLALGGWVAIFQRKPAPPAITPRVRFDPAVVIIIGWVTIALLYFLPTNLSAARVPYTDEGVFWYVQAADFVNIPPADRAYTRCLYSHSYGIPFISALPNLLFHCKFNHNIYYMPVILIFQIGIFLNHLRKDKWAFVFFNTALLMTVMRHLWWRQLFLGLIYGEGIAAVFFMILMAECWRASRTDRAMSWPVVLLLSFGIGLLAYTKPPTSVIFFFVFPLVILRRSLRPFQIVLFLIVLFIPISIWMWFSPDPTFFISKISGPDSSRFGLMIEYLIKWYTAPLFFAAVSLGCICMSFRKTEWMFLVPVLSQFLFIAWGYLFVFSQREYESAGRYIMHGMLALYFLGSLAFSRILSRFQPK